MVVNLIKMHLQYMKIALFSAFEYRANFFIQVGSMILNDVIWIIFWLLFFQKFTVVNGWSMDHVFLMYAIVTTAYGLGGILFGNRMNIAGFITQGKLDYYLTLPKPRLYHLLASRSSTYDLGDLVFGLILAVIFVPLAQWPLFIVLSLSSMLILNAFMVIVNSLAFYMGSAESTSKYAFFGMLSFASYPMSVFRGVVKVLIMTILPAGFVAGIPIELLQEFHWGWFLITIGVAILFTLISTAFFYHGLKRYESGNLLYVRT